MRRRLVYVTLLGPYLRLVNFSVLCVHIWNQEWFCYNFLVLAHTSCPRPFDGCCYLRALVAGMHPTICLPVTAWVCRKDRCHRCQQGIMHRSVWRRSVWRRVPTRQWRAARWITTWVGWLPRASTTSTHGERWNSPRTTSSWRGRFSTNLCRRLPSLLPHHDEAAAAAPQLLRSLKNKIPCIFILHRRR